MLEAFGVMVFERIMSRAEDPLEEATPPARGEGREMRDAERAGSRERGKAEEI